MHFKQLCTTLWTRRELTDSKRNEVVDALKKTRKFAIIIEESFRVKLGRVVPVTIIQMNGLVVAYDDSFARNHKSTEWRFLLSRVRDTERHCKQDTDTQAHG